MEYSRTLSSYPVLLRSSSSAVTMATTVVILVLLVTVGSGHPSLILCHPDCDCLDVVFDCTSRNLTTFPGDFPTWINKLNISKNRIDVIQPNHLSRLAHLESLSADGNNLTRIPSGPDLMEDLVELSLSRNEIQRIDGLSLSAFPQLRDLDLSQNQIQVIDNSSFPMNNQLLSLNLAGNALETLNSSGLNTLRKLTDFQLSNNRIQAVAKDAFTNMTNLEKLDLSRNKIETMESLRFQELKKLQVLNLRRNGLGNFSDAAFYGLEKVQQLLLDWNNIRLVEKRWLYGLRSVKTFNVSHNEVSRIEDDSWEFVEQVQSLDLSYNLLTFIGKKTLSGLSKLRTLDLSRNKIVEIEPDAFVQLEKLETLDLSHNELSWVLEDTVAPFRGLKECHTLNLASNRIHVMHPESLYGLSHLRFINLSDNPITWLSEKTFLATPAVNLQIFGTYSLVCDCEIQWLHAKLVQQQINRARHEGRGGKGRKLQQETTMCAFPLELANRNLLDLTLQNLSCSDKYRKPVFLEEPKTQTFLVEGNGTLVCHLQAPPNIPITVEWKKDYKPLPRELQSSIETSNRVDGEGRLEVVSRLNLVNVSWTDSGWYQCVGKGLGIVYSKKANVTVHIFPTFVKKPSNITVRLGSNVKFECGSKGYPIPEIGFQKDGGEDFPAALERRFHVMPNDDSFFIMEVKMSDQGMYSCSAKNTAGEVRAYATVTVFETPSFRYPLQDQSVVLGSNAILECAPSGSPKPQIVWTKDGVQLTEILALDKRYHLTENGSLLLIKEVHARDSGKFECLLTNAVGVARSSSTLTVVSAVGANTSLDNTMMTIVFIIIAVFCVVVTSAAWVVVIYTTRKRQRGSADITTSVEVTPLKFEDPDMSGQLIYPPLSVLRAAKVIRPGYGSQSSSGKDSGNGEDFPESLINTDAEDELGSRAWMNGLREVENFSTFGGARPLSTVRNSQPPRLDLKFECDMNGLGQGDSFNTIPAHIEFPREYGSYSRNVPIPTVPAPSTNLEKENGDGDGVAMVGEGDGDPRSGVQVEVHAKPKEDEEGAGQRAKILSSISTPV